MIHMHDLSARFDHHSNKFTMCTVEIDQVPDPLMGPHLLHWDLIFYESIGVQLVMGAFRPSGHLTHTPCPCGTRLKVARGFWPEFSIHTVEF